MRETGGRTVSAFLLNEICMYIYIYIIKTKSGDISLSLPESQSEPKLNAPGATSPDPTKA